ncbi:hypothetical protein L7E35_004647 [Vibrio parahaemolyticus]|nr:hypothetical protein [Vibrio parahaemolyticus]EIV1599701.1 hypothetical protein [Vibrio parahaemolyticus]
MVKTGDFLLIVKAKDGYKYFKSVKLFMAKLKMKYEKGLSCEEAYKLAKIKYPNTYFNLLLCDLVEFDLYDQPELDNILLNKEDRERIERKPTRGFKIKDFKTGELFTLEELCCDNFELFKEFINPLILDQFSEDFTLIFTFEKSEHDVSRAIWGFIDKSRDKNILIVNSDLINQYNKYKSLAKNHEQQYFELRSFDAMYDEVFKSKTNKLFEERTKQNRLKKIVIKRNYIIKSK